MSIDDIDDMDMKFRYIITCKAILKKNNRGWILNEKEIKTFHKILHDIEIDEPFGYVEYKNCKSTFEGTVEYIDNYVIIKHIVYSNEDCLELKNIDYEWIDHFIRECKYDFYKNVTMVFLDSSVKVENN